MERFEPVAAAAETAGKTEGRELRTLTCIREVTATYRGPRRARTAVTEARVAAEFIRKILPDNSREHMVALYLDGAHSIVAYSVASTGTANSCQVYPREIFQGAVLVGAVAIILGHNHPGGSTTPSEDDRKVTQRLKEGGALLGIKVLDHVIVADEEFHSFSEAGAI